MPKIVTHLIRAPKRQTQPKVRLRKHVDPSERQRTHYTYSGGVTRCSRCPPKASRTAPDRFCDDCARINAARHQAGLIRPAGDLRPSPDNIINPLVVGKYRGPTIQRRFKDAAQPVVTAYVEKLGRGWRRGVATLNGKRIYVGKPVRTVEEAMRYATHSQRLIKLGLQFESDCADYGLID
jgi:hypothetical protein